MENPLSTDWTPQQVQAMRLLGDWAASFTELNQHLSAWMQLSTSDANALGQIVWAAEAGTPLSPAELSRRLGMTSGATSILLNRLEAAGHITRSRTSSDRRRVLLSPVPAAREQTRGFLAVAGAEIAATLRAADPDELGDAVAFLTRITAACVEGNQRLGRRTRTGRRQGTGPEAPGSA